MVNKDVFNATVLYQGRTYRDKTCDEFLQLDEKINCKDIPIGSNPDTIRETNAFCKIVDELINKACLYTKDGQLLTKENKNHIC